MATTETAEAVRNCLNEDLLSADLKWSLFVAALTNYRHDTVLRPFPPMFLGPDPEHKDYAKLKKLVEDVPPLDVLQSSSSALGRLPADSLTLLHWVLHSSRNHQLSICDKSKFDEISKQTGQAQSIPAPNHVFEVQYSSTANKKWEEIRGDREVFCAYHGSRVENFHSILHHGLHSHMNKNSLYGEGTYLSGELSVSMPYAPTGQTFERSVIGPYLSCIVVCELIDDPAVKCQIKDSTNSPVRNRSRIQGSMGGDVPEKYYVVRNNEVIRVKYILVYATKVKKTRYQRSRWQWVWQHQFALSMALYAFLLIAIGLYNSKSFHIYLRKYVGNFQSH